MYKKTILILFLLLSACMSFKENNELAIPPIAQDEIAITNNQK